MFRRIQKRELRCNTFRVIILSDIPALKESVFKDIPALDPVVIRKVRETFGIQGVADFNPEGDSKSRSIPWKTISASVLTRDGYSCRVCGKSSIEPVNSSTGYHKVHFGLEVHHIIPRKDGGSDSFQNLITLCEDCHHRTFSNGYSGVPIIPDDASLYRYERIINLAVPSDLIDSDMRIMKAILPNHQRSERGEIIPFEGTGMQILFSEFSLEDYRQFVRYADPIVHIGDYVTYIVNSQAGKMKIRFLKDKSGNLLA